MISWLKDLWAEWQINRYVELSTKAKALPTMQREAHEIDKLGECTATLMTSKLELEYRLADIALKGKEADEERAAKARDAWLTTGGEMRE